LAEIRPFRAVYYDKAKAGLKDVIMPPYDIIKDTAQYYKKSEYNIARIDKGEENAGDSDSHNKYTRAGAYLEKWISEGVLKQDEKPGFYVYRQEYTMPDGEKKEMTGFFAAVKLEEFDKKIILPHEKTHAGPKADRLKLMRATKTNTSPILSLYFDPDKKLHSKLEAAAAGAPLIEILGDDSVRYRLWKAEDAGLAEEIAGFISGTPLFIADGHHRYETALNFRNEMIEKEGALAAEKYGYILMCLISMEHSGISILPTHRIKNQWTRAGFEDDVDVKKFFDVRRLKGAAELKREMSKSKGKKVIGVYMKSGGLLLELKEEEYSGIIKGKERIPQFYMLDVSVLHWFLFKKLLGMDDSEVLDGLEYTPDMDEALETVESGNAEACFLINPSTVGAVREISLNNETMPQKSTYFLPKLATGIVINRM